MPEVIPGKAGRYTGFGVTTLAQLTHRAEPEDDDITLPAIQAEVESRTAASRKPIVASGSGRLENAAVADEGQVVDYRAALRDLFPQHELRPEVVDLTERPAAHIERLAAENAKMQATLAEVSRRNQDMRSHLTRRLDGEAAEHFFRPLAVTERIIGEALE